MLAFKNNRTKFLEFFGRWIVTPLFAVGSAMLTTVAIASVSFIAGLPLLALIPILAAIFVAETAVSVYLFKNAVPETLVSLLTTNIFKPLSRPKKIVLGIGLFCALGAGLSISALTYISGVTALTAVLGLVSISFPPLGIAIATILAVMGFISISGLFIKWISHAIQNNIHKKIGQFFVNIFTRDHNKILGQQILEGTFKLLFTTTIVAFTAIGTIATLGTMQVGLMKFLLLIPKANMLAIKIASSVIAFGLMGAARLPWALQSVCTVFSRMGEKTGEFIFKIGAAFAQKIGWYKAPTLIAKENLIANESKLSMRTILQVFAKTSAVLIHGFSFGALASSGGGKILASTMADFDHSLPVADINSTAEIAAIVTAGSMQIGISAYPLFFSQPKSVKEPDANYELHNRETNGITKNSAPLQEKLSVINPEDSHLIRTAMT